MRNPLIYIVGTHSTETKGGISTVLKAFEEAFLKLGQPFERINTHNDGKGTILYFVTAWFQLIFSSLKNIKRRRIYWLHCGPWFSMTRKFIVALTVKALGGEVVIHFHSPTLYQYTNSKFGMWALKVFLLPANKVVVVTPWWKSLLEKKGLIKDSLVVANPLAYKLFEHAHEPVTEKTFDKNNLTLVSMARFIDGKGLDLVIETLPDLPNVKLKVIGDGPLKTQLVSLAENLGVADRVEFLGWLADSNKTKALQSADIFCLPSIYDSFGVVFIEAMSLGLPIVAFNNGPVADIVKPHVGITIEKHNKEHLCSAIQTMISNIEQFDSAGKKEVIENYDPTRLTKVIINYLLK